MKNKAWKKKFRQVQDLNPWPLRYWWSLSLSWFLPTRLLFSLSKHGHKCSCLPSTTGIIYMVVELNPSPVTSRALRIICRCLKHIAQRNWAKLMSHMTTFRPYFMLVVLCIIVTMLCVCALPIWICVYGIDLGIGNIVEKELINFLRWKKPTELWRFHQLSAEEHLWTVVH